MGDVQKQFYSVQEAATILGVSRDTVLRQFGSYPGVIDLGTSETLHKRKHRNLRIPIPVFDSFLHSKTVKARR